MPTEANSINAATSGIVGNTGTSFTGTAVTQHAVLVGGATSSTLTSLATGTSGQVLQSAGGAADPTYSTPTYPSASGTTGTILRSNGTNNVYTTATYPTTTTANQILYSSATNTISEITASANGVLITSNSNVPSLLANGTAGQVLTANSGAPPSWTNASGSGAIRLIQSQNASSSASLTFTTGLSFNTYMIVYSNMSPATAGASFRLQFSTNGGSTYIATNYFSGLNNAAYNSATWGNINDTTSIILSADVNSSANSQTSGTAYLVQQSSQNPHVYGNSIHFSNAASVWAMDQYIGVNTTTSTVNALKFMFNSGNIASGTVTLYGIAQT